MALVMAHVELAKAEAGQIAGEVGRVAALGALAIAYPDRISSKIN